MSFVRSQFVWALILTTSLLVPAFAASQTKAPHHKRAVVKKQEQAPPTPDPQPPPPPPTPAQLPAVAPTVTYQYGLLTIVARNSVLSDVLSAVKAKTGANIDIPPNANERVIAQIGPGPARDVLAKLLNGTHFNYVMLGTASNPNAVAQVILTPNTGGPEPGPVAGQQPGMAQPGMPQPYPNQPYPNQPYPQAAQPPQNPGEQGGDGDGVADQDSSQDNAEVSPDDGSTDQANGNENQQNPDQPQVKTPEQLLQELQRQQQQQQQQQGQQQPGTQPQASPQIVYPPQQQRQPQQQ